MEDGRPRPSPSTRWNKAPAAEVAFYCGKSVFRSHFNLTGCRFPRHPRPSAGQRLNRLHRLRRQRQADAGEVLPHMVGIGCTSQRQHADRPGVAENNLGRGGLSVRSKPGNQGMTQYLRIGGEQREALISDLSFPAELPYLAIPPEPGVTTVLNKCGHF